MKQKNTKDPKMSFTIGLYLALVLLFIALPSLKIGSFDRLIAPYELPASVKPGEAIILPDLDTVKEVQYGPFEFTQVSEAQRLLAFSSIYDGKLVRIRGEFKNKVRTDLWSYFLPNQHSYFEADLKITPFQLERAPALKLSEKTWNKVNEAVQEKGKQEREKMAQILARGTSKLLVDSCFRLPLDSTVISTFGSPRSLPNGRKYHHSGIDLRSRTPEQLFPMGEGEVVFVGHMSVPGNMVVIDHGGYLHSRYMHLSKIGVQPGERVHHQSPLGKTGATGRITGPHLHWEVLWHGRAINPMALIAAWSELKGCAIESEKAIPSYNAKAKELEPILFSENELSSEQL